MDLKRAHDVTVRLHTGMPTYPGDPGVEIDLALTQAEGAGANVTLAKFGLHSGTHVDAPYHVDASWAPFSDAYLPALVGPARVVALEVTTAITAAELEPLPWEGVERVLFKTRNGALWGPAFRADYVHLSPYAARFLVEHTKVRLVGIDYLSIEGPDSPDLAVHRTLLGRGVLVLEGLYLAEVEPGDYDLMCLPLKTSAPDGAPVRALLFDRL
jgi:arylformamidase